VNVIPVVDLLAGHAVRAVRGQRSAYRPIRSSLCAGSDPVDIALALLAASGSRSLYVADLDAILAHGDHASALAALCVAAPDVELWIDAGFTDYQDMRALFERIEASVGRQRDMLAASPADQPPRRATLVPVFGTESLRSTDALRFAQDAGLAPILSLDFRAGQQLAHAQPALSAHHDHVQHPACHRAAHPALDPADDGVRARLADDPAVWPDRVIVMTLDHVGSYEGPDLATFARICAQAGERLVIGAGGIRNRDDLKAAQQARASGWLVASALHDEQI
jgi:phosphoribosylformimino-5-aminoimidazole carboxamide ribotide isomerase